MQSKQQRLYYEQNNKEKVRQELEEMAKQSKELENKSSKISTFDPHRTSFYC
jgi:actin-related protein